jgi:tetratricopeptide (TPR) repeat protein
LKTNLSHKSLLLFILLIWAGCSTEKNTAVSRAYHNVTSRYNIYFNGKESLKAGLERIDQAVDDDFSRILPVYKSSAEGTGRLAAAEMDNAILKASKLIKIHSLTKKPRRRKVRSAAYKNLASKEEYNNWVDDSYILMGKAYFYQKNFARAMENFNYVIRKYNQEPSHYEAMVWLIRCYSEQERYNEAMEVIKDIDASMDFPKKMDQDFALAVADFHLKQQEYEETISALKAALRTPMPKQDKARYNYILAQLYKETGNNSAAIACFRKVAKLHPSYIMAFNARIHAAGVFTDNENTASLVKELNKLLKDEKNHEFRDQIYYALGKIDQHNGNQAAAIENYRRSSATSVSNSYQKALSCLTLADIYMNGQAYKEARAYYDSAMTVIDQNYPNYALISERHKSLMLLTDNLLTVEREDSLQALALMNEAGRNRKIDGWIQAERDAEIARKQEEDRERTDRNFYRTNQSTGSQSRQQSSGWYFYNPSTVALGKTEFEQEWGRRKLEDDWRRKNKKQGSEITEDEVANAPQKDSTRLEAAPRINDKLQRAYYLQDLPLSQEAMRASNIRIRDALFNAGRIFKQDYGNYPMAIREYEELLKRYDENIYKLTTYFELWDLYAKTGNQARSEACKNLIVSSYPDSKYAQYLVNPNYFIGLEAHNDSINRLYEQAFRLYKNGKYAQAGQFVSQLKTMGPDTVLLTKANFIETIARGEQGSLDEFGSYLDQYLAAYPWSPVKPVAERIRKLIRDSSLVDYRKLVATGYLNNEIVNDELLAEKQKVQDEFNGKFSYDEDLLHYFVIAFDRNAKVDINRLKFDIANYNIDHYMKTDFDIETEPLNANTTLLSVRTLQNKEQALIYFRSIIRTPEVYTTLRNTGYVNFVASTYNYRELKADHSTEDYLKFFLKNYSRFIGGDFPEGELPEPEELMTRAMEEDQRLKERGTFVMVTPETKPGLYSRTPDAPHSFVIAIKDRAFRLKTMIAQVGKFNRDEFGDLHLKVEEKALGDYRLLEVSPLSDASQAMRYFRRVIANRNLFDELGDRSYRNFIISNANLQTLSANQKLDEYIDFFREYYISGKALSTPPGTETQPEPAPAKAAPVTKAQAVPEGPFVAGTNSPYHFVLLVPAKKVDQGKLMDAIEAHNDPVDPDGKLRIESVPYTGEQLMIRVYPFAGKDEAMDYLRELVRDRQVYGPLEELEYRNFIISKPNLDQLLERKNLSDYMDFYKATYLTD